ncbi:LuxR C-terminal-related transcriptional regulator [uncultured Erythrobacter sp.]|uniref:LuxR C-terminal-related transcriptional regulator n=1 Tax=uncultured Erythrobacter sp. TaxID=263913 RepID=UPI00265B1F95|nr:LuxR C-terminal-related transcriptional regulator [uncultured Erythrobacter sp.]
MEATNPVTRLTEREKEVLRAWLAHKSAKEIAIDLGITHHAVEKRLKMARTKLDAGSSLEAARMLAGAEGYGQAVTAPPDLPAPPASLPSRRYRSVLFGGIAMSLALIVALALSAPHTAPDGTQPAASAEIALDNNLEPNFAQLDANGSGYLEGPESPFVELALLDTAFPVEPGADHNGNAILGDGRDPAQVAEFYAAADTDADGRVSFREYYAWSVAQLDQLGVEVTMVVKALPDPQS